MSELTLFNIAKLPAYLKGITMDETTRNLMGGGDSVSRISIRGGVFRKIVNGEEVMQNDDRAMNVVIVKSATNVHRTFYAGTYKEGENAAPDCWSSNNETPDAIVRRPQSPKCGTCPQNIKGSGQGESRACRYTRRIAVVLDNDISGDVLQIALPSQSIFGKGEKGKLPLEAYVKFLAGNSLPVTAVVTEMRFDTASATPKLTFKPIRPLEQDEYTAVVARAESPEAMAAVTMSFTPKAEKPQDDAPVDVDPEVNAVVAAAVAQQSKADTVADAPADAPPKVRGKGKAADVKSVLAQWADDDE
jgi:Na+-transporting methylmalonyl-CoA/oxaloacetate decarboxylase gamma subunit